MLLRCLPHIVTAGPGGDELWRDLVHPEVVLSQHVECELVAHEVVRPALAVSAVDDAQCPVADAAHAHADVAGEQVIRAARDLERAKGDGRGDEEDGPVGCGEVHD